MNYIFIDYENENYLLKEINQIENCFYYFYTNYKTSLRYSMPEDLKKYIKENEYMKNIEINGSNLNLLDTKIMIDISRKFFNVRKEDKIFIISRDKGYDNFITNFNILTKSKTLIKRLKSLYKLEVNLNSPIVRENISLSEIIQLIKERMKYNNKARTVEKLKKQINHYLINLDTPYTDEDIIKEMIENKDVFINQEKIYYGF
jgi:hypothetical protein